MDIKINYFKKYYKKNKEKILVKNRAWSKNVTPEQREKRKVTSLKWQKDHLEYKKTYNKDYRKKKRLEILTLLGGKCKQCGFADSRALQIDHVNGGGTRELRTMSQTTYYKKVFNDIAGKYQLLCANCNWIKKYEKDEC